ncbi:DNA mismatch repair endonuclease MutL [Thalassotalea marina]|uniref:DNA mismatch repair protein MutL n=1 Tax=Thalassotalea marina TaxID=1673741 RepID=A0A919BEZ3_9GAMM|nr:DNA mismatch repair endonuclease MutL [Thalassotalea marina]GHF87145.1 DNA mismatch repair protein MutL [Thalassotalea marina]
MTIQILPARLANQIAAGEVVERPASVVKELVENSLDAGATIIKIEIEKGGAKRIRISDNGSGIAKDELTLALSRHATSKIKDLDDLEGISSLGFRGEALASISSVSRLTLTSKPEAQEEAWQAQAFGRDMEVTVQPAAHGNGTTIDVVDLFFNTPARRKFLRTEKTEFSHIEEVIKRIALAKFNVAFTLVHNSKVVKQFRLADTPQKQAKRVAQVCGNGFIEHAHEVYCQHDGLTLSGWIASPQFSRSQNDLCYSYVNGRMMRDKLINHAIRQAYQDMLPADHYPAFVLFLELNVKDVDVNVHPAKHEVRFHHGRYIHDFIYSICHKTLVEQAMPAFAEVVEHSTSDYLAQESTSAEYQAVAQATEQVQDYIQPLRSNAAFASGYSSASSHRGNFDASKPSSQEKTAYSALMSTPYFTLGRESDHNDNSQSCPWVLFPPCYAIYSDEENCRLLSLKKLSQFIAIKRIEQMWPTGITSQPLLLPVKLNLSAELVNFVKTHELEMQKIGIHLQVVAKNQLIIRQYPAILRQKDVTSSFIAVVECLYQLTQIDGLNDSYLQQALASQLATSEFTQQNMLMLYQESRLLDKKQINEELTLNSTIIDLTSSIQQLDS